MIRLMLVGTALLYSGQGTYTLTVTVSQMR